MTDYWVEVTGAAGPPVLLLPGGAASSRGFFPGLGEALDGHRLVSLDRPGTGLAQHTGRATLASGSAAAAQVLTQLDAGPAVVVGQSLGGAVAVQFATDHPELVAGLMLIDPTPVDMPRLATVLRSMFEVLGLPGRVPIVGARLDSLAWKALSGRAHVVPEARAGLEVMLTSASIGTTARALRSFGAEAAALASRLTELHAPVIVLSADRKPNHAIRQSHERLAVALGGRLVTPPGAVHAEHLRDPRAVQALVLQVVAEAGAQAP